MLWQGLERPRDPQNALHDEPSEEVNPWQGRHEIAEKSSKVAPLGAPYQPQPFPAGTLLPFSVDSFCVGNPTRPVNWHNIDHAPGRQISRS